MLTAKIPRSTIAKQSTVPASTLEAKFKTELPPGTYRILRWEWAPLNHQRVTFASAIAGFQTWLIAADDIDCEGEHTDILLPVPYYSQRDNRHQPVRTCNSSSCAMAAEFLKVGSCRGSDDWFWQSCVNPEGDSTDHQAMTRALKRVGIESEFRYDLNYADIDRELEAGRPLVLGLLHRGTLANPKGGHMAVCIGRDKNGYIFHDPWGHGFSYDSVNGECVHYPRQSLDARWLADGDKSGWGRIFKS